MSNKHTPPPIVQSIHNMYWTRGSMSTYKAGWQGNVSDMDLTQTHTTAKSRQKCLWIQYCFPSELHAPRYSYLDCPRAMVLWWLGVCDEKIGLHCKTMRRSTLWSCCFSVTHLARSSLVGSRDHSSITRVSFLDFVYRRRTAVETSHTKMDDLWW